MMTLSRFAAAASLLLLISASALAQESVTPPPAPVAEAAAPAALAPATPTQWQVMPDKSSIEWAANYSGRTVTGSFKNFTADILFDPAHLDQSHVSVTINTSQIASDDKDAEGALPGAEWFDSAKTPQATFDAKTFRHIADEQYEADGILSLGDKHVNVTLPFTLHIYDDNDTMPASHYAQVSGETTLKRTALGVGKGDWEKTDTVGDDVKVTISLKAKSATTKANH